MPPSTKSSSAARSAKAAPSSARSTSEIRRVAELLKQVSDPTRLQVLMLLSEKEGNVAHAAGLIADFSLDDERSCVADLLEGEYEAFDADFAFAQRNFFAPLARCFGSPRVLDMHRANIRTKDLHCPDRIAHVVEQH